MTSAIDSQAWKRGWRTDVLPLGRFTGDRRWFFPDGVSHRTPPMPLMFQIRTARGHEGAVVVGAVERMTVGDDMVQAEGSWLDPEKVPEVTRALALMEARVASVSADLERDMIVTAEEADDGGEPRLYYRRARISGVTIVPMGAFEQDSLSPMFGEETALALTKTSSWRSMPSQPREAEYNADEAFQRILAWADGDDAKARSMFLWFDPSAAEGARDRFRLPIGDIVNGRPALNFHAVYAAAALVSGAHGGLPTVSDAEKAQLRRTISDMYARFSKLFDDAGLSAPWDRRAKLPDVQSNSLEAMVASAAPIAPPDEWFSAPPAGMVDLDRPVITPQGRYMAYLARWDTCHRALQTMTGQCFTPPSSPSKYQMFMDGSVVTASGRTIPVGRVTVDTTHADLPMSFATAKQHYDNTGSQTAVVRAGEDERGIWLAGAIVPEATPQQVALLRRSPLSGDWRRHGAEGLDLVAALAVNMAGYPVVPSGRWRTLSMEGGECATLVASGDQMGDDIPVSEELTEQSGTEPTTETAQQPDTGGEGEPAVPETPAADPLDPARIAAEAVRIMQDQEERQARLDAHLELDAAERMKAVGRMPELTQLAPMLPTDIESLRKAQKQGKALPPLKENGRPRFYIRNEAELKDAIRAVGRAGTSHNGIRRWIMTQAGKLGLSRIIPPNWNSDGSLK